MQQYLIGDIRIQTETWPLAYIEPCMYVIDASHNPGNLDWSPI